MRRVDSILLLLSFKVGTYQSVLAQPFNEDCVAATSAPIDGSVISGTTVDVTPVNVNDIFPDSFGWCPTTRDPEREVGVWYTITGSGQVMTASTCSDQTDHATSLSLFTGTCQQLLCATPWSNTDTLCPNDPMANAARIIWPSVAGQIYYLYVQADLGSTGFTGDFGLTVQDYAPPALPALEDPCVTTPSTLSVPSFAEQSWNNQPVLTSSVFGSCGASVPEGSSGVWFAVTGTGSGIRASTCGNSVTVDLYVFSGSCPSLTCVTGNDGGYCQNANSARGRTASWQSTLGVDYYILAVFDSNTDATGVSLALEEIATPTNDVCSTSVPVVAVNSETTVSASTTNATQDLAARNSKCSFDVDGEPFRPGVWFQTTGTGAALEATSCLPTNDGFNVRIAVYSGDCNNLQCVAGMEARETSCSSTGLIWDSVVGTRYYILVSGDPQVGDGSMGFRGDFNLQVREAPTPQPTPSPTMANDSSTTRANAVLAGFTAIAVAVWTLF